MHADLAAFIALEWFNPAQPPTFHTSTVQGVLAVFGLSKAQQAQHTPTLTNWAASANPT